MLKANVGSSISPNPRTAGTEAAAAAKRGLNNVKMAFVYSSCDYNIKEMLADVAEELPGVPLIGVPVYEAGIPGILNSFLTGLKGSNKPVVLIAVYGNMSEGTALNELYSIAHNSGFNVIGAGSFIGEHSFSTEETPIAKGRPDSEDICQNTFCGYE